MAENIGNKIVDKTKEDDYVFAKKVRDYKKLIKFYLIPIVSVLLFLVILIFTVIPNVKYMLDGLEEAKALRDKSDQLDARIERLKVLQEQQDRDKEILAKIDEIIPSERSEVVKFRQKVASTGVEQGLSVETLQAGEIIIEENDKNIINKTGNLQLIEIPSKFSFSGNFDSFRQLFRNLYAGDDFFIISNMDLDVNNIVSRNSSWKGQFDLTKYQFSEERATQNYADVPETEPVNQEVVRFIEDNFGI